MQFYRAVKLDQCGTHCFIGGINASCEVVGSYDVDIRGTKQRRAFVWRPNFAPQMLDDQMRGTPWPTSFEAFAISDTHVVAGGGTGPLNAALTWATTQTSSSWTSLPIAANGSRVFAINDSGVAVGEIQQSTGTGALLWDHTTARNIGDLPHRAPLNNARARHQ